MQLVTSPQAFEIYKQRPTRISAFRLCFEGSEKGWRNVMRSESLCSDLLLLGTSRDIANCLLRLGGIGSVWCIMILLSLAELFPICSSIEPYDLSSYECQMLQRDVTVPFERERLFPSGQTYCSEDAVICKSSAGVVYFILEQIRALPCRWICGGYRTELNLSMLRAWYYSRYSCICMRNNYKSPCLCLGEIRQLCVCVCVCVCG